MEASLFNAQKKFIGLCKPIHVSLRSHKRVPKDLCFQLQDGYQIFRIPKMPTLQNQTLLIALYMYTFRMFFKCRMKNITQEFLDIILKHGDDLVFHALHNLKYDDSKFEVDAQLIEETLKSYPVMIYRITESQLFMALYGISIEHRILLQNFNTDEPFYNLITFERLIMGMIESKYDNIFTTQRLENLQKTKPDTKMNMDEHYKIMINKVAESRLLNIFGGL